MNLPLSLRWGDSLVVLLSFLLVGTSFAVIYPTTFRSEESLPTQSTDRHLALIQAGQPVQRIALTPDRIIAISGPAGITEIEISGGRVRCLHSPGPQGICAQAGWLEQEGELAVSLPNRLMLQIQGREPIYDSIVY